MKLVATSQALASLATNRRAFPSALAILPMPVLFHLSKLRFELSQFVGRERFASEADSIEPRNDVGRNARLWLFGESLRPGRLRGQNEFARRLSWQRFESGGSQQPQEAFVELDPHPLLDRLAAQSPQQRRPPA